MRSLVYVLIGFAVLVGVFVLIWLYRTGGLPREQLGLPVQEEQSVPERPEAPEPDVSPEAGAPSPGPTAESSADAAGVVESAPLTSEIREEVRANPHATPPSLVRFSRVMAARMERALGSFDEAESLFPELESCVQQSDRSSSARVVCLNNAERLAGEYPVLSERYADLQASSPEEIQKLHRAMNVLAGKAPPRE